MLLYRVLLTFDYVVAAILFVAFAIWNLTTHSLLPGLFVWLLVMVLAWAAIGTGVYFRKRDEMLPANLSLALLALLAVIVLSAAAAFFWLISQIEVL